MFLLCKIFWKYPLQRALFPSIHFRFQIADIVLYFYHLPFQFTGTLYQPVMRIHLFLKLLNPVDRQPVAYPNPSQRPAQGTDQAHPGHGQHGPVRTDHRLSSVLFFQLQVISTPFFVPYFDCSNRIVLLSAQIFP